MSTFTNVSCPSQCAYLQCTLSDCTSQSRPPSMASPPSGTDSCSLMLWHLSTSQHAWTLVTRQALSGLLTTLCRQQIMRISKAPAICVSVIMLPEGVHKTGSFCTCCYTANHSESCIICRTAFKDCTVHPTHMITNRPQGLGVLCIMDSADVIMYVQVEG